MALFHFKKKPEPAHCCCCEDDCCAAEGSNAENNCCEDGCCTAGEAAAGDCCCCEPEAGTAASVKVLGGGCKNCHRLMENTQEALKALGMDDTVELIDDMAAIAAYGVMATPALVVDGKVLSSGRVLTPDQAREAIQAARSGQ